ncbi:L,D-transpeptidase [Phenylobacterium sp.]|uniref:L,D-transpeptidase family protein n=1 Tax=Phenylobacterium sp. TaxID=1871053 RepID=UPI0027320DA8|nr:L,D-transpeptidase family protein [Phenylobacterium sp.]MDP1616223.1 L,D-transpeptidase family protein [Phenylobacterium sp.]MDP1988500.1 L,D-transpeptidase family protein [Phenylobacterium sp.]
MIFHADSRGRFRSGDDLMACAIGRGGMAPAADKREGDGVSPIGVWPLRYVLYRPDRGPAPTTALPVRPIAPDDGWCDDPAHPDYNRLVKRPFAASHEALWREDGLYDLVVVLGHNDDPPVAPLGSAIFLHLAKPDYAPTEGCIALSRPDLEAVLARAAPGDALAIEA